MTRRRRRSSLLSVALGSALAGIVGSAGAAEIAGTNGVVTLVYDDAVWSARLDREGEPELSCMSESCGGDTAGCGSVIVERDGNPLTEETFLGGFRENLGEKALENTRTNAGKDSRPEIVAPATVADFGGKTGVSLSMRVAFGSALTRVDHFWLLAGSDLAGLTCIVADAEYDRARPAFERIFADLRVNAP